jgi:hypothetical protein
MFELNEDAKVASKDIKGRTVVIVDNFYRNPDEVRDLALSLKYGDNHSLTAGFPGIRCSLSTPEIKEKLYNLYLDLCTNKLNGGRPFNLDDFNWNWDNQGFMVNCTNDSFMIANPLSEIPHQDYWDGVDENQKPFLASTYQLGSVIYLNTPDECAGGTNLYSYKGEMSISSDCRAEWQKNMSETYDIKGPVLLSMSEEQQFNYIKERVDNQYTVEFEAEMVYNRMVVYQADILHKGNIELGMFVDYHRLNQVMFL